MTTRDEALATERDLLGIPEAQRTSTDRARLAAAQSYLAANPGPMERAVLDLIEGRTATRLAADARATRAI